MKVRDLLIHVVKSCRSLQLRDTTPLRKWLIFILINKRLIKGLPFLREFLRSVFVFPEDGVHVPALFLLHFVVVSEACIQLGEHADAVHGIQSVKSRCVVEGARSKVTVGDDVRSG